MVVKTSYFYAVVLCTVISGGEGIRHVKALVPLAVKEGENATLRCFFDLEGDQLYSVKWYRGIEEIYRFVPKELPSIKVFHRPGLKHFHIEKSRSNATHLVLHNVTTAHSGKYSCEVSADAPFFRTAQVWGEMHVVVVPTNLPEVQGVRHRYKVGDTLKATCLSEHSRPAANLTWSINGQTLSSDYVRQYRVMRKPNSDLETSLSTISIELNRDHFQFSGRIKVRCTASLYNIYWRTSETSAEEERPKASVVAAQDYRLNEVLKRPTNPPYDATPPSNSGTASVVRWLIKRDYLMFYTSYYMFLCIYV